MMIEIINKSKNDIPTQARLGDAGVDIRADFSNGFDDSIGSGCAWDDECKCVRLFSGGRCIIPTGLYTSFKPNYVLQICSRSGLAIKNGIIVLNSPGIIDS